MTDTEASKIVAGLMIAFPKADWSADHQRMFADRIRDLDVATARRALLMLIESSTFPPSIGEFRTAACQQELGLQRIALDAWSDVKRAIRYVGYCGKPKFADPIVAHVVERMGWQYLCTTDCPDGVIEKRFCDFYEAVQDNEGKMRQLSAEARPIARMLPCTIKQLLEGIGTGGKES